MNDGRVIETNNLWYNGVVPKERCIEDNACFIKPKALPAEDLFNDET